MELEPSCSGKLHIGPRGGRWKIVERRERGRRLIAEPTLVFKQVNSSSTLVKWNRRMCNYRSAHLHVETNIIMKLFRSVFKYMFSGVHIMDIVVVIQWARNVQRMTHISMC